MTNHTFPLNDDMGNGATVSDWLGTAASAARRAANDMRDVRDMSPDSDLNMFTSRAKLMHAQKMLAQATDELNTIIGHVEMQRIRSKRFVADEGDFFIVDEGK